MKTVGIVCEYNPFHTGHKRQIDLLRENGAENVICVMSGNYTQRGELTIADKYTRAEAVVKCGVDLVLELPFPFSSYSAEGFARAGVHVLANLGCDTISFGSECADKELLTRAADVVLSERFVKSYTEADKSLGAARSYFDLLSAHLGDETALLSNDILAISYICAIKRAGFNIEIFPIKRDGAAYTESKLGDSYPSATAIREAVENSPKGFSALLDKHLPPKALEVLRSAQSRGYAPVSANNIGSEILSFFRLMSPDDITSRAIKKSGGGSSVAEEGSGIVERLCNCARKAHDYKSFISSSYNSRYTDARINRVILFSLIGVSDIFAKAVPQYTTLLGASQNGRAYLSEIRKKAEFPIITKPADAPECELTDILRLSDSLYASAIPQGSAYDHFIKKHPFMG